MKNYLELLADVKKNGIKKTDRTGVGTYSVFARQLRFDLRQGFPIITTKKVHFHSVVHELLWFLQGQTNINYLKKNNVKIWDDWADENGDLGPIYGKQWRDWQGNDQIANVIDLLQKDPDSRRILVSSWNVAELSKMALMPCHVLFQFYVANGCLSCQVYQRSADLFLGVPFNISSYALLTHMIANLTNLSVGELVWSGGDVHLYQNHLAAVDLQLTRSPKKLPVLQLKAVDNIDNYKYEDICLLGYEHYPVIKAEIAV